MGYYFSLKPTNWLSLLIRKVYKSKKNKKAINQMINKMSKIFISKVLKYQNRVFCDVVKIS